MMRSPLGSGKPGVVVSVPAFGLRLSAFGLRSSKSFRSPAHVHGEREPRADIADLGEFKSPVTRVEDRVSAQQQGCAFRDVKQMCGVGVGDRAQELLASVVVAHTGCLFKCLVERRSKVLVTLEAEPGVEPGGALQDGFAVPAAYAVQAPYLIGGIQLERLGGLGVRGDHMVVEPEILHLNAFGGHLAREAAPGANAGFDVARADARADARLALKNALEHQLADAGTDCAAADTELRGQLDLIRQKCASLVFGPADQFAQELLNLGSERDGTLMIQLQHALMYKQTGSRRQTPWPGR